MGQLKGQLTRHARIRGLNASCACTVDSHFSELTVFLTQTCNKCLVSLSNFVIVLINW